MAIVIPIETVPTNMVNRTFRTTLETPVITPGNVSVYREIIAFDADNNPIGDPVQAQVMPTVRGLAEWIAEPPVTVDLDAGGSVAVSAEMIIKAIAKFSDQWVQSEIEAGTRTPDGRTIIMVPPNP